MGENYLYMLVYSPPRPHVQLCEVARRAGRSFWIFSPRLDVQGDGCCCALFEDKQEHVQTEGRQRGGKTKEFAICQLMTLKRDADGGHDGGWKSEKTRGSDRELCIPLMKHDAAVISPQLPLPAFTDRVRVVPHDVHHLGAASTTRKSGVRVDHLY